MSWKEYVLEYASFKLFAIVCAFAILGWALLSMEWASIKYTYCDGRLDTVNCERSRDFMTAALPYMPFVFIASLLLQSFKFLYWMFKSGWLKVRRKSGAA